MTGGEDEQEMKIMVARMQGISKSCRSLWLPISDERAEGNWENTHTNSPAKYLPWNVRQPDGLESENYVVMERETSAIRDGNIEELHCSSCTLKTNAVLTLRGGCKDSLLGKTRSSRDECEHQCSIIHLKLTDNLDQQIIEFNRSKDLDDTALVALSHSILLQGIEHCGI